MSVNFALYLVNHDTAYKMALKPDVCWYMFFDFIVQIKSLASMVHRNDNIGFFLILD